MTHTKKTCLPTLSIFLIKLLNNPVMKEIMKIVLTNSTSEIIFMDYKHSIDKLCYHPTPSSIYLFRVYFSLKRLFQLRQGRVHFLYFRTRRTRCRCGCSCGESIPARGNSGDCGKYACVRVITLPDISQPSCKCFTV